MYIYLLSFTGKFVYIYVWYLKTNYKLCVYFHVGVNIFHWCSFLHSFHTPFQNSPYGHRTDAFLISFMFFLSYCIEIFFVISEKTLISHYQKHP